MLSWGPTTTVLPSNMPAALILKRRWRGRRGWRKWRRNYNWGELDQLLRIRCSLKWWELCKCTEWSNVFAVFIFPKGISPAYDKCSWLQNISLLSFGFGVWRICKNNNAWKIGLKIYMVLPRPAVFYLPNRKLRMGTSRCWTGHDDRTASGFCSLLPNFFNRKVWNWKWETFLN